MTIVDGDPEPARAAGRAPAPQELAARRHRARARRPARSSRRGERRKRRRSMLGVSLVIISLVPFAAAARRPRPRRVHACAGLAIVVLLMLPWSVWEAVFGQLADELLDLDRRRADDRHRRGLGDRLQRRPAPRRGHGDPRPGPRRSRRVLRMSMAYPLRSRFRTGTTLAMFTLVVFTLVTGTTSTGSFMHAFNDVDTFGGGFDIRAGTGARGADRRHARRARPAPGNRRRRLPVGRRASPSLPWRRGSSGTGRPFEDVPRPRRSTASFLAAHDVPPRRHRARLRRPPRGVDGAAGARRGSRSSTVSSCSAATVANFGVDAVGLPAHGLLLRGRDVRPGSGRGARHADRREDEADGHRRARRHRAPRDERHLDLAGDARGGVPAAASRRRSTTSRVRPGVDAGADR